MSAKAQKAVDDALVVAATLQASGHVREAEIIRRVVGQFENALANQVRKAPRR